MPSRSGASLRCKVMTKHQTAWLGTAAAAEQLGIGLRTLYRVIDSGALPAYKIGRVIRLQQTEIDAYITRIRIRPGTLDHLYSAARVETAETTRT